MSNTTITKKNNGLFVIPSSLSVETIIDTTKTTQFPFKTTKKNKNWLFATSFAPTVETSFPGMFISKFLRHPKAFVTNMQFNEFLSKYKYVLNRYDKAIIALIQKEFVRQIMNNTDSRPIGITREQWYHFAEIAAKELNLLEDMSDEE